MKISEIDFSEYNSDDLGIEKVENILPFNRKTIRNLVGSGRLKRVYVKNKYIYDLKSVKDFYNTFDWDNHIGIADTKEILSTHGIQDRFKFFGKGTSKNKCLYQRMLSEFPISPTQLIHRGYLKVDTDIKPTLVLRDSISDAINSILTLTGQKPINNIVFKSIGLGA